MNQWQNISSYLQSIEADLRSAAPRSSGALGNSISASIAQTSSGFDVNISMLDYGVYQDQGVNGTETNWGSPFSYRDNMPPPSAFSQYSSDTGVQYAIARSIYKKGIAPKRFVEPVLDANLERLADFTAEELWDWFYQQNK